MRSADPAALVMDLGPDRLKDVAYVQLIGLPDDPKPLLHWAEGLPIELVMDHPGRDFSGLYRWADLLERHPLRVSVRWVAGFERAVKLAVALELPVQLRFSEAETGPVPVPIGPLAELLDAFLHRATIGVPIEPFYSLLLGLVHREPPSLWALQEEDPAQLRWIDEAGSECFPGRLSRILVGVTPTPMPADGPSPTPNLGHVPDPATFVADWCNALVTAGAECADCRHRPICRGYFKWPHPDRACTEIKGLFQTLEDAADELRRDLSAAPPTAAAAP